MEEMSLVRFDVNDDIKDMLDAILGSPGLKREYRKDPSKAWISMIGDRGIEEGVREIPEIEQEILEKYFLKDKHPIDISVELGIPLGLLAGHIKTMNIRLRQYA